MMHMAKQEKDMGRTESEPTLVGSGDQVLVTGAAGFIGFRVVEDLLNRGFRNVRCLVRRSSAVDRLKALAYSHEGARVEVIEGNLLSREDCAVATKNVKLIYHLAAGRGEKSYPDAFMNSVVTTRNLLDASIQHGCLKRFVNVSSFTVYSKDRKSGGLLDESCPIETQPALRGEAYCFAKVKQDELVIDYGKRLGLPYVIVRPGSVYGPGNEAIPGRVGIATFGLFLHLGGSNKIPFTYVDNCADAIVLAGLKPGIDGEVFNVVDDDLPSSRKFLHLYKKHVKSFHSLYVPGAVSWALCGMWEKYSAWSEGQLPPVFNRPRWHTDWKQSRYSNEKLKTRVGWKPLVSTADAMQRHFASCRSVKLNA